MRRILLLLASFVIFFSFYASAQQREVFIYNWNDYIAEEVLVQFTEETGIKVNYDVYDSNELLESKLFAGNTGYDIVVPTGSFLDRQIRAGIYQKLDRSQLPNLKYIDANMLERSANHDPGNLYSIPYMWGTTGIGYNVDKVKEILGEDAPVDSYDLLFKEEYISKLNACGVHILDSPSDVIEITLNYLGRDPFDISRAAARESSSLLRSIRPHVTKFHSSAYIDALANGDICLAVGYSGDVFQAQALADEAENGVSIEYVIPNEGTIIWFDLMAIPKDAPNVAEAHEFINFIMRPEIIGQITNYVWYANPNSASNEFVDEEILTNTSIYPDDEVLAKLFAETFIPENARRLRNRHWLRIVGGR